MEVVVLNSGKLVIDASPYDGEIIQSAIAPLSVTVFKIL
jgi:hypothetical protein